MGTHIALCAKVSSAADWYCLSHVSSGQTGHVFPTVEAGASGPATTWSSSDLVLHWAQCPLAILNICTYTDTDLPIATEGELKKTNKNKNKNKQSDTNHGRCTDEWSQRLAYDILGYLYKLT